IIRFFVNRTIKFRGYLYGDRFMEKLQLSESCKSLRHADCAECMCSCHVPGTIENLARKISLLDKKSPGIGETI
ncbi:MAG TPA: hypothetical protein VER14_07605, partial [Phototrophicaceae bacterium]|nr:hypothetical protein [Phototrophicaceae bacterium]